MENERRVSKFNDLAIDIHKVAVEHGWWEGNRQFPEVAALIHAEVSEALEEYRKYGEEKPFYWESGKPEGLAVELIDAIIRILDYLISIGVYDPETILLVKHGYNQTRPYRHGDKKA